MAPVLTRPTIMPLPLTSYLLPLTSHFSQLTGHRRMATTPPPSPNPLGADAPPRDYVGLALVAMAFAVAAGTAIIAVVTWTVRTLQAGAAPGAPPSLGSAPAVVLLAGTVGGLALSAASVWIALAPVRSPYRQGGLAMATTFATFLVSAIATFGADAAGGRPGLLALALLAALLAWRAGRAVGRQRDALR